MFLAHIAISVIIVVTTCWQCISYLKNTYIKTHTQCLAITVFIPRVFITISSFPPTQFHETPACSLLTRSVGITVLWTVERNPEPHFKMGLQVPKCPDFPEIPVGDTWILRPYFEINQTKHYTVLSNSSQTAHWFRAVCLSEGFKLLCFFLTETNKLSVLWVADEGTIIPGASTAVQWWLES